jgi:hypothetical protein
LFEEIAKIGEASVRRIYGDFSNPRSKGWADILSKHAIIPQQQFAYTTGKNASDITLVIDAMDLLHSGRFDGFCLVSSDSDFTRLAARIREHGHWLVCRGIHAYVGSQCFDEAGAAEIRRIAQVIKDNKNKVNVTIKGFADPTGPKEWNLTLSKERADQVYFRLINLAGDPIKKCELGVVGMGEATFDGDLASQRVVKITITECK